MRSVLLAAAAGILACADPTAPLSSSAAIIYSLRSSGDVWADLYLIGLDGTRSRPFSSILGEKINPTWSPDGRTVAFMADVMYVANGDGTELRRVPENDSGLPTWSPDGAWLAFVAFDPQGRPIIDAVHPDGSGRRTLVSGVDSIGRFTMISWSPQGRIAFKRDDGIERGTGSIWSVKSDGSGLVQLTKGVRDENPIWSPDGNMLAFTGIGSTSAPTGVVVVNANGSGRRSVVPVAGGTTFDRVAAWSPDGRWLLFARTEAIVPGGVSTCAFYKVAIDGTKTERVSREMSSDLCGGASWR